MLRRRLFGDKKDLDESTIKTSASDSITSQAKRLSKEEEEHENLANELLRLTTAMKQNFQVAGNVIKEDNATLSAMQNVTETNRSNLEKDAKRLKHHASKSCFECTVILIVFLVIWSFFAMLFIMKIFPKRT